MSGVGQAPTLWRPRTFPATSESTSTPLTLPSLRTLQPRLPATADVTKDLPQGETFDLIFMNSLMHHLSDAGAVHLLESLTARLVPRWRYQCLDLVLSDDGLPRKLAVGGPRKCFPRPVAKWRSLVGETLEVVDVTSYDLHVGPVNLWEMIHLKAVGELVSPHLPEGRSLLGGRAVGSCIAVVSAD